MDEFLRNILYFFSRHSGINAAGFTNRILQYYGTGRNDRIAVHYAIVHYDGAHPDQHIIMHRAPVDDGVMPDRNIIADRGAVFLVGAMNTGTVLHIHFIAQPDKIYIPPNDGIEPEAAIIPAGHITHDGGIGGDEIIVTELREFVINRKDDWHRRSLMLKGCSFFVSIPVLLALSLQLVQDNAERDFVIPTGILLNKYP
jgi:hypothetical protein